MTKKDRTNLIAALNIALKLYVPDKDKQKAFAEQMAYDLQLDFVNHFVEACIAE